MMHSSNLSLLRTGQIVSFCITVALGCIGWCSFSQSAESAVGRLSGFDLGRIAALSPWCEQSLPASPDSTSDTSTKSGAEVAKLLYQVKRFARGGLNTDTIPFIAEPTLDVGDVAKVSGEVTEIQSWSIPVELAETLEMATIYRVTIKTTDDKPCIVITPSVPNAWLKKTEAADNQPLHRTNGSGVVIRAATEQRPAILATAALAWMIATDEQDTQVPSEWKFLSDHGLDLSSLETVRQLDRQHLQPEDSQPFYALLGIASQMTPATPTDALALIPSSEAPVNLLKQSKQWVGRFVRLELQTIRFTRVRITDETTQQKVGSDSYWQLDCVGDLGNVVVKIDNGSKEPAVFENRYPVSIVVRDLPNFLMQQAQEATNTPAIQSLASEQIDTAMVSTQITVDGFFYRLWSYESKFMDQHGGGDQFGPLVIAARVLNREPPHTDVIGVRRIGWFVGIVSFAVIMAALIGGWLASRHDAAAKRRQREMQPTKLGDAPPGD